MAESVVERPKLRKQAGSLGAVRRNGGISRPNRHTSFRLSHFRIFAVGRRLSETHLGHHGPSTASACRGRASGRVLGQPSVEGRVRISCSGRYRMWHPDPARRSATAEEVKHLIAAKTHQPMGPAERSTFIRHPTQGFGTVFSRQNVLDASDIQNPVRPTFQLRHARGANAISHLIGYELKTAF